MSVALAPGPQMSCPHFKSVLEPSLNMYGGNTWRTQMNPTAAMTPTDRDLNADGAEHIGAGLMWAVCQTCRPFQQITATNATIYSAASHIYFETR